MSDDIHKLKLDIGGYQAERFAESFAREAVMYSESLKKQMLMEINGLRQIRPAQRRHDDEVILTPVVYVEHIDPSLASSIRLRDNQMPFNKAMERIVVGFAKEMLKHIQIDMYRDDMRNSIAVESRIYLGVRRN